MEGMKKSVVLVFAAGLLSSAITIVLIYLLLVLFSFNITGLYLIVIPLGAIIAGAVAGLGYSVSSRLLNIRVNKAMMAVVFLIALAVYAAGYYATFVADTGETAIEIFIQYVRSIAENSSMTIGKSSRTTIENLGGFGYVFLVLEFLGFAVGSTGPLLFLSDRAYCKDCKAYMKPRAKIVHQPPLEKWDVTRAAAPDEKRKIIEQNDALLKEEFEKLKAAVQGKTLAEKEKILSSLKPAEPPRSYFYLTYEILKCPKCDRHRISAALSSLAPKDYSSVETPLGELES